MKIYFEDGKISVRTEPKGVIVYALAENGPTRCYERLKYTKEFYNDEAPVYTNSIIALLHAAEFAWNKETKCFDIYLRCKGGEWKNIHELTTRELRQGHNIWKLWWAGEFEERQENTK